MNSNLFRIAAVSIALAISAGPAAAKKGTSGESKADYRSAKSGKYVKQSHAEKNKATTVREERKKK